VLTQKKAVTILLATALYAICIGYLKNFSS